jgi:hypothetical protein
LCHLWREGSERGGGALLRGRGGLARRRHQCCCRCSSSGDQPAARWRAARAVRSFCVYMWIIQSARDEGQPRKARRALDFLPSSARLVSVASERTPGQRRSTAAVFLVATARVRRVGRLLWRMAARRAAGSADVCGRVSAPQLRAPHPARLRGCQSAPRENSTR